jgi:hypothetical protein
MMNTKIALGIVVVGVIVVAIGFYFMRPVSTSVSTQASTQGSPTSTTSQKTAGSAQPTITVGAPAPAGPMTTFDASSLISASPYPVITGTANVPQIGVIISNSMGVGVTGSSNVSVVRGHWSYADSAHLAPGNYTVILFVGKTITAGGALTVR